MESITTLASIQKIKEQSTILNTPYAILKIFIDEHETKPQLTELYTQYINTHNANMTHNKYYDSGFDVYVPYETYFNTCKIYEGINIPDEKQFIDFKIKCEMMTQDNPSPFYLFPRSSISKKPIMLANSIGLIDCSYRGNIKGCFRYCQTMSSTPYIIEQYEKIVQIVHPNAYRIFVVLVDSFDELTKTERNDGGFGSTGK